MKRLHFAAIGSSFLVSVMGVLAACSSDDTIVNNGTDSGTDGGNDTGTDTGNNSDTGTDAQPDVVNEDVDAGFKPDATERALGEVICQTLARCCFGDANLDAGSAIDGGGTYKQAACLDLYLYNGFEQSHPGSGADLSRITLNQAKAAECSSKMKALSCNLGFAEFNDDRAICYQALVGTVTAGNPCYLTGECAPGNFCNKSVDGGVGDGGLAQGKCEAIRAVGAACGDFTTDPALAQHACSNKFSGNPSRYCEYYDTVNDNVLPQNQWTCKDARPNGQLCLNNSWCASGLCDPTTNLCTTPVQYFPQTFCDAFKNP